MQSPLTDEEKTKGPESNLFFQGLLTSECPFGGRPFLFINIPEKGKEIQISSADKHLTLPANNVLFYIFDEHSVIVSSMICSYHPPGFHFL
jgi:hypothetical protein